MPLSGKFLRDSSGKTLFICFACEWAQEKLPSAFFWAHLRLVLTLNSDRVQRLATMSETLSKKTNRNCTSTKRNPKPSHSNNKWDERCKQNAFRHRATLSGDRKEMTEASRLKTTTIMRAKQEKHEVMRKLINIRLFSFSSHSECSRSVFSFRLAFRSPVAALANEHADEKTFSVSALRLVSKAVSNMQQETFTASATSPDCEWTEGKVNEKFKQQGKFGVAIFSKCICRIRKRHR